MGKKLSDSMSGTFLKGEDIDGKQVPVTLVKITEERLPGRKEGDPDEDKFIAHFEGKEKTLVLNRTNCAYLVEKMGIDDIDEFSPTQLILYTVPTSMGPGIRVRSAQAVDEDVPF